MEARRVARQENTMKVGDKYHSSDGGRTRSRTVSVRSSKDHSTRFHMARTMVHTVILNHRSMSRHHTLSRARRCLKAMQSWTPRRQDGIDLKVMRSQGGESQTRFRRGTTNRRLPIGSELVFRKHRTLAGPTYNELVTNLLFGRISPD